VIPAITFFVGVIALFFYPISKKLNEHIQDDLAKRRLENN
jgi:sugar transporter